MSERFGVLTYHGGPDGHMTTIIADFDDGSIFDSLDHRDHVGPRLAEAIQKHGWESAAQQIIRAIMAGIRKGLEEEPK